MRKFILHTIIFLLFASLFYIISLFIWERFAPSMLKPNINYHIGAYGHLYTRLSEVKNQKDVDILFLGSSHTYRGFDTRIFSNHGLKTFNLGSSSQTPTQTNVLLERYLDRLNPKTIIYEVYPETFMIDGVESSLDIIANDRNDQYSLKMALEINNIKTYNTFIYGFIRDLFNLNKSFSEPIIKGNDTYISGGYVEKKIGFFSPASFEKKKIILNNKQLENFSKIVSKIKNRNIELILVYAPIPQSNYIRYTNNEYFDNIMKEYSKYINFNEIMPLNDSLYFQDSHHLNQQGVELFNEKLIEIMQNNQARTHPTT